MSALAQYEEARAAIAHAMRIDELLPLLDEFELAKLRARQIKDQALLADATEYQMRAERRLGEVIQAAKDAGLFLQGRQPKSATAELSSRPTLAEAGIDKKLSAKAQSRASIAERAFEAMVQGVRQRIAAGAATVIDKEAKIEQSRARRQTRERVLGEYQQGLPEQKFGIIYADPPWHFDVWSEDRGVEKSAQNQYPTLAVEEICALAVKGIVAADALLFLWITSPRLFRAPEIFAAWAPNEPWQYVSHYVWDKEKIATGYWNRNRHEVLLIAKLGQVPQPLPEDRVASVYREASTVHSAKPDYFAELIERQFPSLPKIELFRRGPARLGWHVWGNEAEPTTEHAAARPTATALEPAGAEPSPRSSTASAGLLFSDDEIDIPAFLRRKETHAEATE